MIKGRTQSDLPVLNLYKDILICASDQKGKKQHFVTREYPITYPDSSTILQSYRLLLRSCFTFIAIVLRISPFSIFFQYFNYRIFPPNLVDNVLHLKLFK